MKRGSSRRSRQAVAPLTQGVLRLETLEGRLALEYRLKRSPRARYMRLSITREHEVVLTLPRHCSLNEGLRFLRSKAEWIHRHLSCLPLRESLIDFLTENPAVSVYGRQVAIIRRRSHGYARIEWGNGSAPWTLWIDPSRHGDEDLTPLFRQAAADVLTRYTRILAARVGAKINRVSVRDQSSLWGSCSGRKTISLNWRLLLLPPPLQRYVILHELAHLTEMNHSERFWRILRGYDPVAEQHDADLTRISSRMMALGRMRKEPPDE